MTPPTTTTDTNTRRTGTGNTPNTNTETKAETKPEAETGAGTPARHLPGLDNNVRPVKTRAFLTTQKLASLAADLHEVAAFYGDPGLGKTFAIDWYVRNQQLPWIWLDMPEKPSPKELTVRLLTELAGTCDHTETAYVLTDQLTRKLAERPRIVVIDEAQNLKTAGFNQLRYFHDRPDAKWALLLVGGARCNQVLSSQPELDSRIAGRVNFQPLDNDTELLETLNRYHPLFANTPDELLLKIDDAHAKGIFRRWARILQLALNLPTETPDKLTTRLVRAILTALKKQ